jgi:hypothetical protein
VRRVVREVKYRFMVFESLVDGWLFIVTNPG